ncbi:MAG TPA: arabinofuranosidase catalytic domain-containing protein, partial [Streptosporangiaceae bacterium]
MSAVPKSRRRTRSIAVIMTALAMAVLTLGAPAATGGPAGQAHAASSLPCDVYAAGGTPCATAHSTTRALFASYNGPLYQIQRASDRQLLDVGLLAAGGVVNAAPQTSFCSGTSCTITKIYDQTGNHNDMPISWGGFWKGPGPNGADVGADAMALPVTVAGHQAFGVKVTPGVGYRIDNARGVPTGSQPAGIYMVTSSNLVNGLCCFDYGSGENSHTDTGNATMNAIEWGTACWFGGCVGSGPWVEADLENGMYHTNTGSNKDPNNSGVHFPFVSAWEKNNGTSNFTLKYGNATSGGLTRPFSGPLPNGYSPMRVDSSILLGTGGDNSNGAVGEFFEGAVTFGYPSDATEDAVQAGITAAGYGSGGGGGGFPTGNHQLVIGNDGLCLDVNGNSTASGAAIIQWSCNGQTNQQFQF